MDYVPDTHSLVWYFTDDSRLSRKAAEAFQACEREGKIVVPAVASLLAVIVIFSITVVAFIKFTGELLVFAVGGIFSGVPWQDKYEIKTTGGCSMNVTKEKRVPRALIFGRNLIDYN